MSKHKSRPSGKNYRTEEYGMFILNAEIGIQEATLIAPSIRDGDRAMNTSYRWLVHSPRLFRSSTLRFSREATRAFSIFNSLLTCASSFSIFFFFNHSTFAP
jgi:hypothetical protein